MDDDCYLYVRLANAFLNLSEDDKCVAAARAGVEKGGLTNPDHAQMTLGMCLYNEHDYGDALRAFRRAAGTPRSAGTATQWIGIVKLEMQRQEQIELAEAQAVKRNQELAARRAEAERT